MKQFFTQLMRILAPAKRQILAAAGILIVFEAVKIAPPYLFKQVIDTLTLDTASSAHKILYVVLAVLVAENTVAFLDLWVDRLIFRFLYWVERYLPNIVQEKLLSLPMSYHEEEQTGEKISRLERGTEKLINFLDHSLLRMYPLVIQVVWTTVVLVWIDWQLTVLFVCAIPPFVAITWHMHAKMHPLREKQEDAYEHSSGRLVESIMHIGTVQAFAQEPRERKEYGSLREEIESIGRTEIAYVTKMNFWRASIVNLTRTLIMGLAAMKVAEGELSVGSVVFFLTLSEKVYGSLFSLSQIMDRMVKAVEPLQRLFAVLDTTNTIPLAEDPQEPEAWQGAIEFDRMSFGYTPGKLAIDHMSLEIKPGEIVAFAGPSGGGKSTIVKLLLRFFDPLSGTIRIDGVDLREIDLAAYRARTGYVPQEVGIMSGTVWYNICYGRPDATREEILQAAKLARVDEFVARLPKGYETLVGERGMKLSGGQRQRLGIARALIMKPSILIFDEATSNLDAESEHAIQAALEQVAGSATMIIIAHRLSTIMKADKIVVVDQGRIVEVGDHATLMKRNGLYERLVRFQTTEGGA